MTSAKAIKEAAKYRNRKGQICYEYTESQMQAFEEAICREQRENCYNAYLDSGNESPLELFEIMINAPKPTT